MSKTTFASFNNRRRERFSAESLFTANERKVNFIAETFPRRLRSEVWGSPFAGELMREGAPFGLKRNSSAEVEGTEVNRTETEVGWAKC
ncbi:MAG: hypothetical protein ACTS4T_00445 [Candidatus Hodgkinia cicadicola]